LKNIRLLFDSLHHLSTPNENKNIKIINLEEKKKNLINIKNYFISWKENTKIKSINKPSNITFDNNINSIKNWLKLIEFIELKKNEEKILFEEQEEIKNDEIVNYILNYEILFSAISTLIVEHQFSVIRFKNPLPTALFYFQWNYYSFVVMSILNLPESTRGFSINNEISFHNLYYGKITTNVVPKFIERKKTIFHKLDEETKKKINLKLTEINANTQFVVK
jgi:hypothetical protein